MERNRIVAVFDNFTAEKFIDTVELAVNSFSFNAKGTVQELIKMPSEKQNLLRQAIDSCIFVLANTDRIDGRNEVAAEICKRLNPTENPLSDVGNLFLRMHPTLQQTAAKLFCCYLDKAEVLEYKTAIEYMKKERGDFWYCFPLI